MTREHARIMGYREVGGVVYRCGHSQPLFVAEGRVDIETIQGWVKERQRIALRRLCGDCQKNPEVEA